MVNFISPVFPLSTGAHTESNKCLDQFVMVRTGSRSFCKEGRNGGNPHGSNGTVADSSWLKGWKLLPSTEMTITDGDFQLFVSRKWKPRMCAVYHKAWQRKVLCWICRVVQLLERFPPNFPPLMSECFAKMANNHLAEEKRGTFSARARSEIEKVYLKKNLRTQIRFFRSLFMGEI